MKFEIGDSFLLELQVIDEDYENFQVLGLGIEGSEDLLWISADTLEQQIMKHDKNAARHFIQKQIKELQQKLENL